MEGAGKDALRLERSGLVRAVLVDVDVRIVSLASAFSGGVDIGWNAGFGNVHTSRMESGGTGAERAYVQTQQGVWIV